MTQAILNSSEALRQNQDNFVKEIEIGEQKPVLLFLDEDTALELVLKWGEIALQRKVLKADQKALKTNKKMHLLKNITNLCLKEQKPLHMLNKNLIPDEQNAIFWSMNPVL